MKLLLSLFFLTAFITMGFSQSGSTGTLKTLADTTIQINWADWTSGTAGAAGVAEGQFNTSDGVVDISYSGEVSFIQLGTGTNYFNPATPFLSSAVINAPPAAEMIGLSKATAKTLTFSQPVNNLFFAVVSLNSNGYKFNRNFEIVSTGCGYWGCGTLTKVVNGDGTFQLNGTGEPHGVIRFTDYLSSITWTSLTNETWNGFTIGTYGVASLPVEMVSFSGSNSDNQVTLNWQTATETNNYGWEIQREGTSTPLSDRSAEWETVGFVAGKGTTTEPQNYSFLSPVTRNPSPEIYRLKQIDLDGTISYSKILSFNSEPSSFLLYQNYPNPFNPSTTISYSLPSKGFVKLVLFDILGREIKSLVSQEKEAGFWTVSVDASLFSAGTYFYSLTFNGKTETRSMVMVK